MSSELKHRDAMSRYYAWHSGIYDATRWAFLLGRNAILADLELAPGQTVVEIGCGTGRNLEPIALRVGRNGRVLAVDCASPMIARTNARIQNRRLINVRLFGEEYGSYPLTAGTADVVLMSYSLSMIPSWEAVLACAYQELRHGGRIGVVDFCQDSHSLAVMRFARWMAVNHVALERGYREKLSSVFRPLQCITRKAFGGLWSYYRFVGERP